MSNPEENEDQILNSIEKSISNIEKDAKEDTGMVSLKSRKEILDMHLASIKFRLL